MEEELVIKLSKQELQLLFEHLLEDLHTWSEKGVEGEEKEEFQQMLHITSKLCQALEEERYIYYI
jgi:hypothetical protein